MVAIECASLGIDEIPYENAMHAQIKTRLTHRKNSGGPTGPGQLF